MTILQPYSIRQQPKSISILVYDRRVAAFAIGLAKLLEHCHIVIVSSTRTREILGLSMAAAKFAEGSDVLLQHDHSRILSSEVSWDLILNCNPRYVASRRLDVRIAKLVSPFNREISNNKSALCLVAIHEPTQWIQIKEDLDTSSCIKLAETKISLSDCCTSNGAASHSTEQDFVTIRTIFGDKRDFDLNENASYTKRPSWSWGHLLEGLWKNYSERLYDFGLIRKLGSGKPRYFKKMLSAVNDLPEDDKVFEKSFEPPETASEKRFRLWCDYDGPAFGGTYYSPTTLRIAQLAYRPDEDYDKARALEFRFCRKCGQSFSNRHRIGYPTDICNSCGYIVEREEKRRIKYPPYHLL